MGLILALALGFMQGLPPPPVPAPAPPPINVSVTNVLQAPPMDPQVVSDASAIADQSFVVNTVQPVPVQWTNAMCQLPNIWTTTPPNVTYDFPDLRDLATLIGQAAMALIGLALLGAAIAAMAGADVHERLGRVVFAAVMSVGNQVWWQWGIGLNNALAGLISPPDVCGTLIRPHIQIQTPEVGSAVAAPVLVIVFAVVALLLLFSLAFRLGLIDVLFAAGPLAELCWATPQSEHIAQWYQRLAIGTIFGQVLLAIGLRTAHALSSLGGGLAATLLAIVVLLICRRLLSVLSSQQHERSGASLGMSIALLARRAIVKVF